MRNFLGYTFFICLLAIPIILGVIIYEAITKKYKYKIKNLIKISVLLVVIPFIIVVGERAIEVYGPTAQHLYIDAMQDTVKKKENMNIEYDEKSNTLIIKSNGFTISNGTLDEYLSEYIKGNEKIEKDVKDVRELKDSCIQLCNSTLEAQSKFDNVSMNVIVQCIEKNSGRDMFVVKNGKLEYNILDNAEKLKVEKENQIEEAKKVEEAKSKAKEQETTVANIPRKASNLYEIKFGKLLDATENNNVLIIKAKIEPSYNNKTTINQNGFNIEDLILNKNVDSYDEIQYWAVADMEDGTESKVISFTVDKSLIKSIKNKNTVGNQIIDQAKDVWILPSLLN